MQTRSRSPSGLAGPLERRPPARPSRWSRGSRRLQVDHDAGGVPRRRARSAARAAAARCRRRARRRPRRPCAHPPPAAQGQLHSGDLTHSGARRGPDDAGARADRSRTRGVGVRRSRLRPGDRRRRPLAAGDRPDRRPSRDRLHPRRADPRAARPARSDVAGLGRPARVVRGLRAARGSTGRGRTRPRPPSTCRAGRHVVVATGHGVGQVAGLPAARAHRRARGRRSTDPRTPGRGATALYLAPTKALAADQLRALRALGRARRARAARTTATPRRGARAGSASTPTTC